MSRPRVVVLSDVFPPRHGGSGRWLWELYRRLEGIDVAVVAGRAPNDAAFDRAAPFPVERWAEPFPSWGVLSVAGVRGYLRALGTVRRVAGRHCPDAIHAGKCLPEGLLALVVRRMSGVPYWVFVHGEELTLTRTSRELRWWTDRVLGGARMVVANSEHTQKLLVDDWRVPPDRIAVLTPGVDTTRFVPALPDDEARGRLGWVGRRVILTAGALQKRKGQDMLIRALPAIRRRCPDVLYAMAGDGPDRASLARLAGELGVNDAVQFLGPADDETLIRCYQQCDLFVLANRQIGWDFEGFGIVLLEAQACGRPVVAGASGGTVETIIPGQTGELVSSEAPDRLAETCAALLDDPARRARLGEAGRAWVEARFDWAALVPRARTLLQPPRPAP